MALLDTNAHYGDGPLVHVDAGGFLRGQRAATSTLERPSPFYVLAFAGCCRVAFNYSRADEPFVAAIRRPNIAGLRQGIDLTRANVRYWLLADTDYAVAIRSKADMGWCTANVCL